MIIPRTVYAMQHNATKRIYIGSSKNVEQRYKNHIYALRGHKHPVEAMQADFDEYGEDFSVFSLETITKYSDRGKEYDWMRKYQTYDRRFGYNYKDHTAKMAKQDILVVKIKEGVPTDVLFGDTDNQPSHTLEH